MDIYSANLEPVGLRPNPLQDFRWRPTILQFRQNFGGNQDPVIQTMKDRDFSDHHQIVERRGV